MVYFKKCSWASEKSGYSIDMVGPFSLWHSSSSVPSPSFSFHRLSKDERSTKE